MVAFFAVVMNLIIILGVLAMFGATFTLPSIAGIVLTVGTAVDANVLIFERMREEEHRGLPAEARPAARLRPRAVGDRRLQHDHHHHLALPLLLRLAKK